MYISPDHVPFLPCYDCHTTSTTVIMTNGSSAELTPLAMPSLIYQLFIMIVKRISRTANGICVCITIPF